MLRLPSVKARVGKKAGDRAGLVGADLEQGETPRTQGFAEAPHDAAIGGKPVRTAVERGRRIVIAHLWGERGHIGRRQIRWVGHHQVKTALDGLEPVRSEEGRTVPDTKNLGIGPRQLKRAQADIDGDAARPRQLRQQGDEDAAAPGAEIEELQRPLAQALAVDQCQRGLDQRLGVRARIGRAFASMRKGLP